MPQAVEVKHDDVLSGQGRANQMHAGNLRYNTLLKDAEGRFIKAMSRKQKQKVVQEVIDEVRSKGNFLRFDQAQKTWYVMSGEDVVAKVAQALRYRRRSVVGSRPGNKDKAGKTKTIISVLAKHKMNIWGTKTTAAPVTVESHGGILDPIPLPECNRDSNLCGTGVQSARLSSFEDIFGSSIFTKDELCQVLEDALSDSDRLVSPLNISLW